MPKIEYEIKRFRIEELNPPPNPAKITDSRYEGYVSKYGVKSWELDALEPQYISNLIEDNILELRDDESWEESLKQQEAERSQISTILDKWDTIFRDGSK